MIFKHTILFYDKDYLLWSLLLRSAVYLIENCNLWHDYVVGKTTTQQKQQQKRKEEVKYFRHDLKLVEIYTLDTFLWLS